MRPRPRALRSASRAPTLISPPVTKRWQRYYAHGECHAFTLALSTALGCTAAFECSIPDDGSAFHSCIRLADGRALDAYGVVTLSALRARYGQPKLRIFRVPMERVVAMALDEEEAVAQALAVAALLPSLPQSVRAAAARLLARRFADVDVWFAPRRGPPAPEPEPRVLIW
jgi:hypothetical protein